MFNSDSIEKTATIYGNFYSWKGDLITNQLQQYSAHTRNELAMLKSLIGHGDNIIDVGAHIGTFSIPLARFNNGTGKIFSIEADIDNYNLLLRNIAENCLDDVITPMHAIVSDTNRAFKKIRPCGDNSGSYSFLPYLRQSDAELSEISVMNLDEWYEKNESGTRIDLIKIDIEGGEMAALRSCERIIKKHLPILYVEINRTALDRFNCSTAEIEEVLKSFGYHFFKNIGARNSENDIFEIARLNSIEDGGDFFDLLAIHPSSNRYPGIT